MAATQTYSATFAILVGDYERDRRKTAAGPVPGCIYPWDLVAKAALCFGVQDIIGGREKNHFPTQRYISVQNEPLQLWLMK